MTQPLPRRRFVQPHFPESLYYRAVDPQTCPECKQPLHPHKLTRREKVEALAQNAQDVTGYVIVRTAEGIEYHLPTEKVAALLRQVERTIDWQRGVCPQWVFTRHPRLTWFKNAISVESTDGRRIHEQL